MSQYWAAIWNAMGFVFLFFFMEETNYNRQSALVEKAATESEGSSQVIESEKGSVTPEMRKGDASSPIVAEFETGSRGESKTTYLDKLKLFRKDQLRQPNRLLSMVIRPLKFVTFPVIFYAGFTYGANLVWFNVLNGLLLCSV